MANIKNNGQCPECELNGINSIVELNMHDYWECPKCRLQLQLIGDKNLGIFNERGNGDLKDNYYKAKKNIVDRVLLRKPLFNGDNCVIKNKKELQEYINMINGVNITQSHLLRLIWEQRGNKNIKYSNRPKRDLENNELISVADRIENIKERFKDLSKILEMFFILFDTKYDLYGDAILAFIGNDLFRDWPWKDFPFTSKKAKNVFQTNGITVDVLGLLDSDIKGKKELKKANKEIVYEHWTPISFFRDIFIIAKEHKIELNAELFYQILIENYRTVRITKEEDKKLNKANKTNRTVSTYKELGIEIEEIDIWNDLFKD